MPGIKIGWSSIVDDVIGADSHANSNTAMEIKKMEVFMRIFGLSLV